MARCWSTHAATDRITDAMRTLLTDDALHAELVAQALGRPTRTWDDYASETWAVLMADRVTALSSAESQDSA